MATMKPTLCGGRAVHAPDCGEDGNCEYYAERAEAWAVGTVGGDPVPSYDLAYENNSKYWAEQSASSASESAESATESTESATQAKGYAETAEQAAEEVTNALGQVMSKTTGIFTQTFTTSTDTSTLTFNPTGYTYSANDDFDVYISGLRLNPSEFSWTGSGSSATITLVTPVTHTGTVIEVVANTSSQMTTDATLTIQGAAADAKATGDEINQLKEDIADIDALSDDVKIALLNCFQHVAWTNANGQSYYNALDIALYPRELISISAVFDSQGTTIYADDTLESLKQYLTVTASYSDQTTVVVTDYTLSGSLVAGSSTLTITYSGKTTTVTITVVDWYEIDERSVSDGLMELRQGGMSTNDTTSNKEPRAVVYTANAPRYSTYVEKGKRGMWNTDNTELTDIYPIPVPSGATTAKVDITPNSQYFALQEFAYSEEDDLYTRVKDSGWKTSGTTITLQSSADFVTTNLKYDSAGTSYPVVPTDVAITFE